MYSYLGVVLRSEHSADLEFWLARAPREGCLGRAFGAGAWMHLGMLGFARVASLALACDRIIGACIIPKSYLQVEYHRIIGSYDIPM